MRSDRLERGLLLTGPLFVALVAVGGPILVGSTPDRDAGPSQVIAFYAAHRTRERAGAVVLALAFVAFLFLAGTLRSRWRRFERSEPLVGVMLAAAVVAIVGQTITAGVTFTIAQAPDRLTPAAAQTLNLLGNDLVLTSALGLLAFGISAGLAILRGVELPAWLGWLAIASGILFVVPPAEVLGLLLLLVWVIAVSVLSLTRDSRSANAAELRPEPS
jgi:NADH:ubiquinone oxidoreductase subunit 6 (subunit J)